MLDNFNLIDFVRNGFDKYGAVTCTGVAVVGVGIVGVTSYRAGKYVGENPDIDITDKLKVVAGPAVAGVVTAGAICLSQAKNASTITAMITSAAANEQKRKKFVEATKNFVGKENLDKIISTLKPDVEKPVDMDDELDDELKDMVLVIDDYSGASGLMTVDEMYQRLDTASKTYAIQNGFLKFDSYLNIMHLDPVDIGPNGKHTGVIFEDDYGEVKYTDLGWDRSRTDMYPDSIPYEELSYLPLRVIKTDTCYIIDAESGTYPIDLNR